MVGFILPSQGGVDFIDGQKSNVVGQVANLPGQVGNLGRLAPTAYGITFLTINKVHPTL